MNPSAGFERIAAARGELWVAGSFTAAAGDLGLADRSRWEKLLGGGEAGGRGKVAFVEAGGRHVVLKQLRR
nr:hypothetical protein [Acidobacteriota bacterium]NIO61021.1 hypothetical protein [Acidobacteriota bacterium]NIQ32015.1 hypothetical protein [Acidobacteriota bacterium]NIQ87534.1 hypothetical protein [Acidobacteriota bacterium]